MNRTAIASITFLLITTVHAQELKDQALLPPPKTKLEAFNGESGAVIIKGYTNVGTVKSLGNVTVAAMTFRNAKSAEETKGLSMTLRSATAYSSETSAYIDYDEIASLLLGIDYIAQADTSATKLANFEATYNTRGNVKITVFNNSSGINEVNIKIGTIGPGAFFKIEDLTKLRESVAAAKAVLDNPDSFAAKGDRVATPAQTSMPAPSRPTSVFAPTAAASPPKPKTKPSAAAQPLKLN